MEEFWKWCMRANARGVLFCALAALAVATAWWTWCEIRPGVAEDHLPAAGPRKDAPESGLGILDYLTEQLNAGATEVPGNPFMSSDAPWHWKPNIRWTVRIPRAVPAAPTPPAPTPPAPTPPPTGTTPTAPAPAAPAPAPTPPAPAPAPDKVSLTYHGVFRRPDGTVLALIEDSQTGKKAFYSSGTEIHGVTLGEIRISGVQYRTSDGHAGEMIMREPASFSGGRDVQ